jgi:hypothetical protein
MQKMDLAIICGEQSAINSEPQEAFKK